MERIIALSIWKAQESPATSAPKAPAPATAQPQLVPAVKPDEGVRERFMTALTALHNTAGEVAGAPTTKRGVGNALIGLTTFAAIAALAGIGLSAAGIGRVHLGGLNIPVSVPLLASIAFYAGSGAMMGFELRKQAQLKEEEKHIESELEKTEKLIASMKKRYKEAAHASGTLEAELDAIDPDRAVALLKSQRALLPPRTGVPILDIEKKRLKSHEAFQKRLAEIYQQKETETPFHLKKLALLTGIGFLTIFGLQMYTHFVGSLHLKSFGLHLDPSLIATTSVLMYGLSLIDLGAMNSSRAKEELEKAKEKVTRVTFKAELEEEQLVALQKQKERLVAILGTLEGAIDASKKSAAKAGAVIKLSKPVGPPQVTPSSRVPGVTAQITKWVIVATSAIALAALGGLAYSFTGSHVLKILGHVTLITPKTMGLIAFYSAATALLAYQVLGTLKTEEELAQYKKIVGDLKGKNREKRGPEKRPDSAAKLARFNEYQGAIQALAPIDSAISAKINAKDPMATAGPLFQKKVGAVAAAAGVVILAFTAYALFDQSGAGRLLFHGDKMNLLIATILASNGVATFYAGVSIWENGEAKKKEATRERLEQDLEGRRLQKLLAIHRNSLIQEEGLYHLHAQLTELGQTLVSMLQAAEQATQRQTSSTQGV